MQMKLNWNYNKKKFFNISGINSMFIGNSLNTITNQCWNKMNFMKYQETSFCKIKQQTLMI